MVEYNVTIPESVVVKIADEVIMYLNAHPEDSVDCIIMKVILDKKSHLSWEFIINNASTLPFPLLFNGEEVDQFGFLRRMFEMREELVARVEKHVTQEWEESNGSSISDPDKRLNLNKLSSAIAKFLSYASNFFD